MTDTNQTAFPLSWPIGWPRTEYHRVRRSNFSDKLTIGKARDELLRQMQLLSAKSVIISSNVRTRLDGLMYANAAQPNDRGIAVYFTLKGKPLALACDRWNTVEDNLWAVAKHIDALRGQDRWGVGSIEQAFSGYTALPSVGQTSGESWWDVLGVTPLTSTDEIKAAYRAAAKGAHPDVGGSADAFSRVQSAWELVKQERGL